MSDQINSLIHTNAVMAFQQGEKTERQRILNLLENSLHHNIQSPNMHKECYTCVLVEVIKGEQK